MKIETIHATKSKKSDMQPEREKCLRVAAYCRVSTDQEEQVKSFDSMVRYYTDYINSHPGWVNAGIYSDKGITAVSTEDRDEFNDMIADALAGKIDYIITKNISRFARSVKDGINVVCELRKQNIGVFFEEENINTLDIAADLILTIYLAVSQEAVVTTSQHVKRGLKMKMSRGDLVGFNCCLGYDYDPVTKNITVNEEEAKVVRYIYDQYVAGVGSTTIANDLNDRGLRTVRGNLYGSSTIVGILKNEKYIGDIKMQKTFKPSPLDKKRCKNTGQENSYYVSDHHEPIVTREIYFEAQKILEIRSRSRVMESGEQRNSYSGEYTFSSKLTCGFCEANLTRKSWHGELKEKYKKTIWQCSRYIKKGKIHCPDCKGIEERVIENAFVDAYNKLCGNDQAVLEQFLKRVENATKDKTLESKARKLEQELNAKKARRQKLVDGYLDGLFDRDVYKQKDLEAEKEVNMAQAAYNQVAIQLKSKDDIKDRINTFRKVLSNGKTMTTFDPVIFEKMVERVLVGGTDDEGKKDPYKLTFVFYTGYEIDVNNSKGIQKKKDKEKKCSREADEADSFVLQKDTHGMLRRSF